MQINAVIGVFMSDDNGVHVGIRTMGQQPRQGGVAKIEHEPETVPLHQETTASPARLRVGATTTEHGHLSHSHSMPVLYDLATATPRSQQNALSVDAVVRIVRAVEQR